MRNNGADERCDEGRKMNTEERTHGRKRDVLKMISSCACVQVNGSCCLFEGEWRRKMVCFSSSVASKNSLESSLSLFLSSHES